MSENTEQFVGQLTENQNRLYGYVYSLVCDHGRAADVVQETNLVLWRKVSEFDPNREFLPWAFAIARFQVLAHLRNQKRDRMLLDADLAEHLGAAVEPLASQLESTRSALRLCMDRLSEQNRDMLERRYFRTSPLADIATSLGRSVSSVKVSLMRIRRQLAECVEQRLASEGADQ